MHAMPLSIITACMINATLTSSAELKCCQRLVYTSRVWRQLYTVKIQNGVRRNGNRWSLINTLEFIASICRRFTVRYTGRISYCYIKATSTRPISHVKIPTTMRQVQASPDITESFTFNITARHSQTSDSASVSQHRHIRSTTAKRDVNVIHKTGST